MVNSTFQSNMKTIWLRKEDLKCLVVQIALKAQQSGMWYLDSGCSGHMTGDRSLFWVYEKCNGGTITFGDSSRSKINRKGTISTSDIPKLNDVLFVEGLKANLLSIS